jgi:hypothetical protein
VIAYELTGACPAEVGAVVLKGATIRLRRRPSARKAATAASHCCWRRPAGHGRGPWRRRRSGAEVAEA